MKKFVIIALIFALAAGAAFAQDGSWSVSGKGEIGTMLNFAGDKTAKDKLQAAEDAEQQGLDAWSGSFLLDDNAKLKALIGANGYHNIEQYGFIGTEMALGYNLGGLSTGLSFEVKRGAGDVNAYLTYQDDTRAFQYNQPMTGSAGLLQGKFSPARLWGYYKFLDGMIHLEAAAASRDSQFFYTSGSYTPYDHGVVANLFGGGHDSSFLALDIQNADYAARKTGYSKTKEGRFFDSYFGRGFFKVDHHNYLLASVAPVEGVSFGVMVPRVFVYNRDGYKNWEGGGTQENPWNTGDSGTAANNTGTPGYIGGQTSDNPPSFNKHVDFLDQALLHSRLGVKYGSGPITISAQFALLGRAPKMEVKAQPTFSLGGTGNGTTKDITLNKVGPVRNEETVNSSPDAYKETVYTVETGLYFGAKYAISDSISASLGFQGEFYSKKPILGFGADLSFSTGALGAGLGVGLLTKINPDEDTYWKQKKGDTAPNDINNLGAANKSFTGRYLPEDDKEDIGNVVIKKATQSFIGLQPTVSYKIIENSLMLSLDSNLFWKLGVDLDNGTYERKWQENVFGYEVTPVLWFNVAGTGAAKGWYSGNNTAIIIRYKVAGWVDGSEVRAYKKTLKAGTDVNDRTIYTRPIYNGVDVSFKWSF